MHNVRIEMTGHGRGKVFLDDVEVKAVTAIDFSTQTGGLNELTLKLYVEGATITGPVEVPADG
jgi:hypothetical protein